MLQSDWFCLFTKTSDRRRTTCASNSIGTPYPVSGMGSPII